MLIMCKGTVSVVIELWNLDSFAFKGATVQDIDKTLAEKIEMGFLATDKDSKLAIFCFI